LSIDNPIQPMSDEAKLMPDRRMPDRLTTSPGAASASGPPTGMPDTRRRRMVRTGPAREPQRSTGRPGLQERPVEPIEERAALTGWPPRDILAAFVLLAVSLQRAHGYVIEDYLRALGLFGITMSTLYRTLRQMEKDGFLQSTWEPGPTGPARRVYTITDAGHAWLDSSAAMLNAYRDTIDRFFGLYGSGPGAARQEPDQSTDVKETRG
jgi:PadR family transcriptional regulator PadR